MNFESGHDLTFPVDYKVDGVYVIPDSAGYELRDHHGVSLVVSSLPAMASTEMLAIPAVHNQLLGPAFEHRYLTVHFLHDGATYSYQRSYTLVPFIPMTATPEKVRAEIGLDESELPNQDIDLIAAYFDLVNLYGTAVSSALTSLGPDNLAMNRSIVLQAALNISNSIEMRTVISARVEDSSTRRSATLDFDKIVANLQAKLGQLVGDAIGSTIQAFDIFQVATPDDLFTS